MRVHRAIIATALAAISWGACERTATATQENAWRDCNGDFNVTLQGLTDNFEPTDIYINGAITGTLPPNKTVTARRNFPASVSDFTVELGTPGHHEDGQWHEVINFYEPIPESCTGTTTTAPPPAPTPPFGEMTSTCDTLTLDTPSDAYWQVITKAGTDTYTEAVELRFKPGQAAHVWLIADNGENVDYGEVEFYNCPTGSTTTVPLVTTPHRGSVPLTTAPATLPRTGNDDDTGAWVIVGAGLLSCGIVLISAARMRRSR